METKKLTFSWDELEEEDTSLISIYSSFPIFRLIFHINKILGINLSRERKDVDLLESDMRSYFPLYHYHEKNTATDYYVVVNKAITPSSNVISEGSLFQNTKNYRSYLVPEKKNVDYFMKIEGLQVSADFISKIKGLHLVSAAYKEDINNLKSSTNLIFK